MILENEYVVTDLENQSLPYYISSYKLLLFVHFSCSEVSLSSSLYLKMLSRWVSGALDPESSTEGDSIMSVKRCAVQTFSWCMLNVPSFLTLASYNLQNFFLLPW